MTGRVMEVLPDFETAPIEVICAPVSGRLLTREAKRTDIMALRKLIAVRWRKKTGLRRWYDGTFKGAD